MLLQEEETSSLTERVIKEDQQGLERRVTRIKSAESSEWKKIVLQTMEDLNRGVVLVEVCGVGLLGFEEQEGTPSTSPL